MMKNAYEIDGATLRVYNRSDGRVMLFNAEDFPLVSLRTLHISRSGYAVTHQGRGEATASVLAHRLLMGCSADDVVDHINRDKLDNRRHNLRVVSQFENAQNRGDIRGYHWAPRSGKWRAQINAGGRRVYLGYFNTSEDAAAAYQKAKKELHPMAT
jgi:hypothetical protein